MNKITVKEEEIMNFFWEKGELFVKQIVEFYPEPKPHYNTVSTMVRALEEKGFLGYHSFGNTYQYYPLISKEEYNNKNLRSMIKKHFGNSFKRMVSTLVEEEDLSLEELRDLIREIEQKRKTKK
ncbi:MAG: BlaI/MecI/CopY family transcriptional regulator [Bacteroidetes bacterium]|nr:BlaI/MecI/CopY family transcriptional regulator [Bacteroidota bacterium]